MSEILRDRIQFDDYELEVRRSPNRKTVEIGIERTGQVVVRAPDNLGLNQISEIASQKKVWFLEKLAEKQVLLKSYKPKEFISGETFYVLGRPYRLKIVDNKGGASPMWLDEGRILMEKSWVNRGQEAFEIFCTDIGREWLKERTDRFTPRVGISPTKVTIRELGFRWGSCSENGNINFHWKVMTLPPKIIDYIILHELVHLIDKTHSESFWRIVRRIMPDYAERKGWLALHGAEHAG